MRFREFNPLDILAVAASLQSPGQGEGADGSQSDGDGEADEGTDDGIGSDGRLQSPQSVDEVSCADGTDSKTCGSVAENKEVTFVRKLSTTDLKVMPRVVKVLSNNGRLTDKLTTDDELILSQKDTGTMTGTSTAGAKDCASKTLAILRVKKTSNVDHSYAVYSKLEKSRMEDDEGYCSRSSLGSPGQCWKSDSEMMDPDVFDGRDSECGPRSPYLVLPNGQPVKGVECSSPLATLSHGDSSGACGKSTTSTGLKSGVATVSETGVTTNRKCTKIVIVSRDANLRRYFGGNVEKVLAESETGMSAEEPDGGHPDVDGKMKGCSDGCDGGKTSPSQLTPSTTPITDGPVSEVTDAGNNGDVEHNSCQSSDSGTDSKLKSDSQESTLCSSSTGKGIAVDSGLNGSELTSIEEDDSSETTLVASGDSDVALDTSDVGSASSRSDRAQPSDEELTCVATQALHNEDQEALQKDGHSNKHSSALLNMLVSKFDFSSASLKSVSMGSLENAELEEEEEDKHVTPVSTTEPSGNHYTRTAPAADAGSSAQREHPLTQNAKPASPVPGGAMVLPSSEQKQQQSSPDGLVAGDSACPDELLLPGEKVGTVQKMSTEKEKSSVDVTGTGSPTLSTSFKSGLVYIMTSLASDVTANATVASPNSVHGAKTMPVQCNKYIIQDDVPPVSKYGDVASQHSRSDCQSAQKSPECGTKLGMGKPKLVTGNKESFVLLRLSNLSAKPAKSSLVTLNPGVWSPVSTNCTSPVVVNGVSPLPQSLLSSPTKTSIASASKSQSSVYFSPTGVSKMTASVCAASMSCPSKKTEASNEEDLTTAGSTAIPRSWSSLLSSHKLWPGSSSTAVQPALTSQEPHLDKNDASLDVPHKDLCSAETETNNSSCESSGNAKDKASSAGASPSQDLANPLLSGLGKKGSPYEGRMTPLGFATKIPGQYDASGGNINIKIAGGVVVDVQQEKGIRDIKNKSSCSIGQVGSLTWQNISQLQIESPTSAAKLGSIRNSRKAMSERVKKDGLSKALLMELKKKNPKARLGMPSRVELYRMKASAQNISELHPLIDHDYCMFTEFSADIQSSIIATMDTKLKPDRRSVKKTKAARTKLYQPTTLQMKVDPKLKKRKYTKRKLNQLLQRVKGAANYVSDLNEDAEDKQSASGTDSTSSSSAFVSGQSKEKFRDRKPKRHYRPRNSGDKNYVKIPGSYQDQFVYYATKKQRGRPRKFEEEHQDTASKSGVTGINEFEWYREMAKIDKGSKFGVASVGNNSMSKLSSLDLMHKLPDYEHGPGVSMPIHESDVVDMVIDMMPSAGLDVAPAMDSSKIFGALMNNETAGHGQGVPSDGQSEDSSASQRDMIANSNEETVESTGTVDPGFMAEFNRLLNSMEEADQLKILVNLTDSQTSTDKVDKERDSLVKVDGDGMLNNLNAYLGSYGGDSHSAGQPPSQFPDLDEINDNDLLNPSELGNIFGDLTTAGTTSTTTTSLAMAGDITQKMAGAEFASFAESSCSSYSMESSTPDLPNVETQMSNAEPPSAFSSTPSTFGKLLDKWELFPDISSTVPQVSSEFGVPDLTLVNMYWNELPGLLINGKEYVRLVDIHKQVLPAKDTGILKKRCQMMGLEIINCSELQRDFLIRYMNAAKSKSCVIVAKEAAKTLIGFYVDPRPRMLNKQSSDSCGPAKAKTGHSKLKVLLPSRKESKVNITGGDDEEHTLSGAVSTTASSTSTTNSPASTASKTGKQKSSASHRPSPARDISGGAAVRPKLEANLKDIKRSPRLKNKKVMYAALHNGGWAEEEELVPMAPAETKFVSNDVMNAGESGDAARPSGGPDVTDTVDAGLKSVRPRDSSEGSHPSSADEMKLSELMKKQKECKLNPKERRRIRRLQKKIRKHDMQSHKAELEHLHQRREKWLKSLEKTKSTRLEKKAMMDKYSQEHCYAASPEPKDHSIGKTMKPDADSSAVSNRASDTGHQLGSTSTKNEEGSTAEASDPSQSKTTKHSGAFPAESRSKPRVKNSRPGAGDAQQTLQVVHMDSVQRSHSQKHHSQAGTLFLSKYQSREAACIECNTCHEMLSVRRFLKHRHHLNNPDELVEVSLPQKLELCLPPQADTRSDEVHLWAQFTQRRQTFSQLLPKRRHPSKVRATTSRGRTALHHVKGVSQKHSAPAIDKVTPVTATNNVSDKQVGSQRVPDSAEAVSSESLTPDDSSRHSGRVRKRKQLYPMESYVFGRSSSPGSPVAKRARQSGAHARSSPL